MLEHQPISNSVVLNSKKAVWDCGFRPAPEHEFTPEELQSLKDRDEAVTKIFYRYGPPTFDPKRVQYLLGLGMSQTDAADAMKIPEDAVRVLCGENLVTDDDKMVAARFDELEN